MELSQSEVEMLRHEPSNSVTDVELIRRISLHAIQIKDKDLSDLLISKIRSEYQVAGLYPHIQKIVNIIPDNIELTDDKKEAYKNIILSQIESIHDKIVRYEKQAKDLIHHCTLISWEEKLELISPYLKGTATFQTSCEIIKYLLGDFYGNVGFEGFEYFCIDGYNVFESSSEYLDEHTFEISIVKVLDLFKTNEEGEIRLFKVEKAELTISREKLAKVIFDFAIEHNVNTLTFNLELCN